MAASWRFYAGLPNTLPKPMFRIDGGELVLDAAPEGFDPSAIAAHHRFDRYAQPYRVGFPYVASLLRVLYYRLLPSAFAANRIEPYAGAWTDPGAENLSLRLLQRQVADITRDGTRFVLLIVPAAAQVPSKQRPYAHYLERVREMLPAICVIDPFLALLAQYEESGSLSAPNQHFNAIGNKAIAAAAFAAVKKCGI